jgi:hypothetical protein
MEGLAIALSVGQLSEARLTLVAERPRRESVERLVRALAARAPARLTLQPMRLPPPEAEGHRRCPDAA